MTSVADIAPRAGGIARPDTRVRARDCAIDTMRGLAIVMVIGIHSLATTKVSAPLTVIDAALRPCVPVFLFASGYLTARAARVPLRKRLVRVIVPYTIAFAFAYLFMALTNPHMDQRLVVTLARYGLAYVFVYYYVFVYAGCTVALWLVYAAARRDGPIDTSRLIVVLMVTILVGLAFGAYLDPLAQRAGLAPGVVEEIRMRDVPFWFGFVAIGAIAGLTNAQAVLRDVRYALAAASIVAYIAYAAIRVARLGDAADYDSMAFFLYAALFCVTMLGFSFEARGLAFLGVASYFIYLWHIFVVMLLHKVPLLHQHAVAAIPLVFGTALAVSALAALALRRFAPPRLAQWIGL